MKSHLIERTNGVLKLVESAKLRKGCIGRIEGPCADFKNPTRNDRLYGLQLWKNVFANELFQESIKTRTAFGELDHPEDRFEVLSKLACTVMTDYEIDEDAGLVYGGFDILDTPQGRILKALLDYGCQMGVSSRGTGDVIETENGEEVDPDTYEFACFDVVSTPAVAKARQTYTESVKNANKKKALTESIKSAITDCVSTAELDAIKTTINNAKVPNLHSLYECIKDRKNNLTSTEGKTISSKAKKVNTNTNESVKTTDKTIIKETDRELVKTMSASLKELNCKVNAYKVRERNLTKVCENYKKQLQDSDSKIAELEEQIKVLQRKQRKTESLSKTNKSLTNNITKLQEDNNKLSEQTKYNGKLEKEIDGLTEKLSNSNNRNKKLTETVNSLKETVSELECKLNESNDIIVSYKNKQDILKQKLDSQKDNLHEHIQMLKDTNEDTNSYNEELLEKLNRTENDLDNSLAEMDELKSKYNKLLEAYKKSKQVNLSYKNAYLEEYANKQGISPNTVKNLIKESTSLKDIRKIVDDVRDKQDRYNKLPISYEEPTTYKVLSENITNMNKDEDFDSSLRFITDVVDSL